MKESVYHFQKYGNEDSFFIFIVNFLHISLEIAYFCFVSRKINIAIDGYSACGKSTTARLVAKKLNYIFIDTGAMYRAVALYLIRYEIPFEIETPELIQALARIKLSFELNPEGVPEIMLDGENVSDSIRLMEISDIVSEVSALKAVRVEMVAQQQRIGRDKGVVMDGRDIGTVVFPHAELKIFMNASLDIRIRRRSLELKEKGIMLSNDEISQNLLHRDHLDSTRKESPLTQATDSILLDTTQLTIPQQVDFVVDLAMKIIPD